MSSKWNGEFQFIETAEELFEKSGLSYRLATVAKFGNNTLQNS